MKSKKGVQLAFESIVVIILLLVVMVVSIVVYLKYINRGTSEMETHINRLGDWDHDGTADFLDKCPCDDPVANDNTCKTQIKDCIAKMEANPEGK